MTVGINFSYWEDLPFSQAPNLKKVKGTKLVNTKSSMVKIFFKSVRKYR